MPLRRSVDEIQKIIPVQEIKKDLEDKKIDIALLFSLLASGYMPKELYDFVKNHKKALIEYIKTLPAEKKVLAFSEALDQNTSLGKVFWMRRGFFKPNLKSGSLRILGALSKAENTIPKTEDVLLYDEGLLENFVQKYVQKSASTDGDTKTDSLHTSSESHEQSILLFPDVDSPSGSINNGFTVDQNQEAQSNAVITSTLKEARLELTSERGATQGRKSYEFVTQNGILKAETISLPTEPSQSPALLKIAASLQGSSSVPRRNSPSYLESLLFTKLVEKSLITPSRAILFFPVFYTKNRFYLQNATSGLLVLLLDNEIKATLKQKQEAAWQLLENGKEPWSEEKKAILANTELMTLVIHGKMKLEEAFLATESFQSHLKAYPDFLADILAGKWRMENAMTVSDGVLWSQYKDNTVRLPTNIDRALSPSMV